MGAGHFFGARNKLDFGLLEAPIADHCNLRCAGCSHHSPFLKPSYYQLKRFTGDVKALSRVSHFGELRIIGGEPLLNPQIDEYLIAARRAGLADAYGVLTNGILLHRMTDRFFELVDYVRIAAYPVTSAKHRDMEELLQARSRRFGFKYVVEPINDFYDIETPEMSLADAKTSFDGCRRRLDFPMIHSGYFYKCMRPPTTREFLENRTACDEVPDFARVDGISLDAPDLRFALQRYMADKTPLQSCRFCKLGFYYDHHRSYYTRLKKRLERIEPLRRAFRASRRASSLLGALDSKLTSLIAEDRVATRQHSVLTRQECQPRELVPLRTPRRT